LEAYHFTCGMAASLPSTKCRARAVSASEAPSGFSMRIRNSGVSAAGNRLVPMAPAMGTAVRHTPKITARAIQGAPRPRCRIGR
jgi:hypothetical protein